MFKLINTQIGKVFKRACCHRAFRFILGLILWMVTNGPLKIWIQNFEPQQIQWVKGSHATHKDDLMKLVLLVLNLKCLLTKWTSQELQNPKEGPKHLFKKISEVSECFPWISRCKWLTSFMSCPCYLLSIWVDFIQPKRKNEREIEIVTFTLFSDHHFFFFLPISPPAVAV